MYPLNRCITVEENTICFSLLCFRISVVFLNICEYIQFVDVIMRLVSTLHEKKKDVHASYHGREIGKVGI